uniref:Uncharacterized protein n=1 Tax=Glycine max TaxID=3847 RepID=C6T893_SOYBN|nr:unknown [Glycine max]
MITCASKIAKMQSLLLGGSLCDLGSGGVFLLNTLDDSNSYGLTHVPHSKTTKGRILRESFNHHGLGWNHLNHTSITILQKFGLLLKLLTRSPVNLGQDFRKLHSNVRSVAVKDWCVSITNLARMVHDNDLGCEVGSFLGRVVLGVGCNKTTLEILDCNILHIKSNIVTWKSLCESLMVHLNRLNLSCQPSGTKSHHHTRLHNPSLYTSHWHSTNTTNLVDILQWKP